MRHTLLLSTAALLALVAVSSAAHATVVYKIDTSNDVGNSGPGPYEQLTVTLNAAKTVATFVATAYPNFSFGDFAVNVNSTNFTGAFVGDVQRPGDSKTPTYSISGGNIGAGLGNFSLIENDTGSNGYSSSVVQLTFTVTNNTGPWSSETNVLVGNNNVPPEYAAAHTFNIALDGASFFSSDSNPPTTNNTPEPMSILVLGSGLLGLGLVRRWNRSTSA